MSKYEKAIRKVLLGKKTVELQQLDSITNIAICLGAIVDRLDALIELLDKRLQLSRAGGVERTNEEISFWEKEYRRLTDLPNCNCCGIKNTCTYCPEPGENVRINCPLWEEKE